MVDISQGSLMVIFCALAASLSTSASRKSELTKCMERRTVSAILERFDFNASATIATTVFGVLANVFPREVCTETVDLAPVMPDEEDEVFGGEVAGSSTVSERTCLEDLESQT